MGGFPRTRVSISPGPALAMPGLRSYAYGRLLNDLDTILTVRATVHLLVVCDLREVVVDTVLLLRERREAVRGVPVEVALLPRANTRARS